MRDAWGLTKPYFMRSDEKWSARGLLLAIVILNLALVGMSVILSYWRREFYNALQEKDWSAFIELLFAYRNTSSGLMPGFCEIAAIHIGVSVYSVYLNQWLQIRWRRWMTRQFLEEWLADHAYYRISLTTDRAAVGTDNPDQRVAEDLRDFTDNTLSLSLGLLSNIVSLASFVGILWGLSGSIEILGMAIPGYMVWVALAYAGFGTWLTHLVGRPLAALNFRQQRVEADFRYALVRVRENIEGIALYRGETEEKSTLGHRFHAVIGNWYAIMSRMKLLNTLIVGYDQVAGIFPVVVAAPRYFAGTIQLGGLMQTVGAFGQVQGSLSWVVSAYASLANWRAIVERLSSFHRAIVAAREASAEPGFVVADAPDGTVRLHDVTLSLPNGTKLLDSADLTLMPGHSVVVTGRSGSGKSTLFRAIAGIWPFAKGRIQVPADSMFLPQRPYIPLGSLRHVVTYPKAHDTWTKPEIAQALIEAGLPQLADHLDLDQNWAQTLSGGEQQRIALARVLLARPAWVFLDEATASLDPESETHLYETLKEQMPGTTVVSIAHRPSVAALHEQRVMMERIEGHAGHLVMGEPVPGE